MRGEFSFADKVKSIVVAGVIMAIGILLFKYGAMSIFGEDILFDASFHVIATIFIFYVLWYFVDQNKNWRVPFFILAGVAIIIVSVQRVLANAHNEIGLLLAFVISFIAIVVARWDYFKGKFNF